MCCLSNIYSDSIYINEEHVTVIEQSVDISADIESCTYVGTVSEKMNSSRDELKMIDMTYFEKYSGGNMDSRHPRLDIKHTTIEDILHYRLTAGY